MLITFTEIPNAQLLELLGSNGQKWRKQIFQKQNVLTIIGQIYLKFKIFNYHCVIVYSSMIFIELAIKHCTIWISADFFYFCNNNLDLFIKSISMYYRFYVVFHNSYFFWVNIFIYLIVQPPKLNFPEVHSHKAVAFGIRRNTRDLGGINQILQSRCSTQFLIGVFF